MVHFNFKHGLSYTKIRNVWNAMHQRCKNPKNKSFRNYGARGIGVCDRWNDVQAFVEDMGVPAPGLTLERVDNSKGYSKDNCRWATRHEQAKNTRKFRPVVLGGQELGFCAAANALGYDASTIHEHMTTRGITHQEAIDHYVSRRRLAVR